MRAATGAKPESTPREKATTKRVVWENLHRLGSRYMSKFEAQKRLRSHKTSTEFLYLLWRSSSALKEPTRGRTRHQLKQIFVYRQLPVPQHPFPLKMGFLAHPQFRQEARALLRRIMQARKHLCKPLHIPGNHLIEARWRTVRDILPRWREALRVVPAQPAIQTFCSCANLKEIPGVKWSQCGHGVLVGGEVDFGDPHLNALAAANTSQPLWPDKQQFTAHVLDQVRDFLTKNKMLRGGSESELEDSLQEWASEQYQRHMQHKRPGMDSATARQLASRSPDMIWQAQDHQPTRLVAYCPALFLSLHRNTFLETPTIFRPLCVEPHEALSAIHQVFPPDLRNKYKWAALNKPGQTLPGCYVLPKANKGYAAARPIITFAHTPLARLHRVVGRAIQDLCHELWKGTWGCSTTEQAMERIRRIQGHRLQFRQDDLKSFFPSIPHQRLMQVIHALLEAYIKEFPQRTGGSITVRDRAKRSTTTSGSGVGGKTVWLQDLPRLCTHALECSVFQAGQFTIRQVRGCCIGSPLSPAWCDAVVTLRELLFMQSGRMPQCVTAVRYVDNRMLVAPAHAVFPENLTNPGFYGNPIRLEIVPGSIFLGVSLDSTPAGVKATMVVHGWEQTARTRKVPSEEMWRYRAAEAAGSESANLSGLLSRLHNACRWSFPKEEARRSICRLLLIYRSLDHEPKPLVSCVRRIARRHKKIWGPQDLKQVISALYAPSPDELQALCSEAEQPSGTPPQHAQPE